MPETVVLPASLVYTALVENGRISGLSKPPIPQGAFRNDEIPLKGDEDAAEHDPRGMIRPVLELIIGREPADTWLNVVVTFADTIKIPLFTEPQSGETRSSSNSQTMLRRAETLVNSLLQEQNGAYEELANEFPEKYDIVPVEDFWLVRAVRMEVPPGAVGSIAEGSDVLYIEPDGTGEEPPDGGPANDADGARCRAIAPVLLWPVAPLPSARTPVPRDGAPTRVVWAFPRDQDRDCSVTAVG